MRSQEPRRRDVQGAIRELVEQDGEPPNGAGDLDAVVGLAFGELQDPDAIGKGIYFTKLQNACEVWAVRLSDSFRNESSRRGEIRAEKGRSQK
jgi:hypothetical protein